MGTIITLYDESEELFNTLGLGVLSDCISCSVKEVLNDSFELTMEYPITGVNYSKIKLGRFISAKPNPYDEAQPFRIAIITKPINGIVTIVAYHLSYDMNGIPCKAVDATGLSEALVKIKENSLIDNKFIFQTDVQFSRKFKTSSPYNVRALLMGDDEESLLGVYNSEVKFDKYYVYLYSKRGKNRGARVCYGNNMVDLNHELTNDRLYNGVFPYYHTETESTETTSSDSFTKVYIVGSKPFQDGWLSFSKNGEAYHPVDSTPVQIDTEGEYYDRVYSWNQSYQKYEEKIYNATVTIMEGIIEPSWIVIDWSTFPNIVCRANAKGYYKLATDTDWGTLKGPGDVIFQGNILTSGITGMASNMIMGYSEVLPPCHSSNSEVSVSSVDVILDDPIIWLSSQDAKNMSYNRILSLDLTSEFNEAPTQDKLKAKAEEYINKHLVGTAKYTTTVSFLDLSSTTESNKYTNFNHVELGDTVKVIYESLGVDVDLRVISTDYDCIKDKYISVELGEKSDKLSAASIQNGDNISSLSNDVGYADITTVNKLIADTVTADYIQAKNASMTEAQIKYLEVAKISCPGIIEASQFTLDQLVATMLTAENAKISQTLEAGMIKVSGDISIQSGAINITSDDGNTSFIVNREGHVTANSLEITGGYISITSDSGTVFEVDNYGSLFANDANIEGKIIATSGVIGGCEIIDNVLKVKAANIESISADSITSGMLGSGSIGIGYIYDTTTNAYINENATQEMKSDWLKATPESQTTLTPQIDVLYLVNNSDGFVGYYAWKVDNETPENSSYKKLDNPYRFRVDEKGNAIANSLTINSTSGTKMFTLAGATLNANDVNITGGSIRSLSIKDLTISGNLYFSYDSKDAYVMVTSGSFSHKVTISGSGISISNCTIYSGEESSYVEKTIDQIFADTISSPVFVGTANVTINSVAYVDIPIEIRKENDDYNLYIENIGEIVETTYYQETDSLSLTDSSSVSKEKLLQYEFSQSSGSLLISHTSVINENSRIAYSIDHFSEDGVIDISTISEEYTYAANVSSLVVQSDDIESGAIYGPNWLTDELGGLVPLTPEDNAIYNVRNADNTYLGFFKWYRSENKYKPLSADEVYKIDEYGINLPGLKTDGGGTKIAGFTATDLSLISTNTDTNCDVGMSNDPMRNIFWGGTIDNSIYPFSVTRNGHVHSNEIDIANYITTNTYRTSHSSYANGVFINNSAISLSTSNKQIKIGEEYGGNLSIVTPKILIDGNNAGLSATKVGTMPYLSLNVDSASTVTSEGVECNLYGPSYNDTDYLYLINVNLYMRSEDIAYINMPAFYNAQYAYGVVKNSTSSSVFDSRISVDITNSGAQLVVKADPYLNISVLIFAKKS